MRTLRSSKERATLVRLSDGKCSQCGKPLDKGWHCGRCTAAIRRLRKSRPDLHEKVMNSELSANAAMVEAGFRKKLTADEKALSAVLHADNRLLVIRDVLDRCQPYELIQIRELVDERIPK